MAKKPEDMSSMLAFIVEKIAEIQEQMVGMREEMKGMATKEEVKSFAKGLATRVEMHEGFAAIREEMSEGFTSIRQEMATKADLENFKEEIMSELRPLSRAFDKDAETLLDHEKRITRLETLTA